MDWFLGFLVPCSSFNKNSHEEEKLPIKIEKGKKQRHGERERGR